ncbi:MAG TPA: aspartate aminotransferase family protein [Mycobacterium sp.]|nr:aspartate aminotransferase family protein [Mycobacterium sp.]
MNGSGKGGAVTLDLYETRTRYVPAAYAPHHAIVAREGLGASLTDSEGRTYLDFAGGVGVLNAGHRHPRVAAALHQQIDRLLHVGPVMIHEGYVTLAARLAELVAPGGDHQTLLVNSGAEAVENAVKVARHATGRAGIIAFEGAFHGRTLLAATMNGKSVPYKTQPGTMAADIYHVPFPYPYRPPVGVAAEEVVGHTMDALRHLVATSVAPDNVAAVVVEPVQGEAGVIVPPSGFLATLREFCRSIGALLIMDEIQTGFGRAGRLFAFQREDVPADILVLGKSLAGGLPLAGVVASESLFRSVGPGGLGGTYAGNPVGCAAAHAVLDLFEEDGVLDAASVNGERVRSTLDGLAAEAPALGDVRGVGCMFGFELVEDAASKKPAAALAGKVLASARENGLIVIRAGSLGNVVRVYPPLVIERDELERGLDILATAVRQAVVQ